MNWRWSASLLEWQSYDEASELWVSDFPELPDWFVGCQGELSIHRFIEIWQQSSTLNDVKKVLFWMPIKEIEEYSQWVNAVLEARGLKELQHLELQSIIVLSEEEVNDLISKELLEKETFYEPEGDVYDPVKALLRAQSKKNPEGTPHIQTVEVGGRYTFRAKH